MMGLVVIRWQGSSIPKHYQGGLNRIAAGGELSRPRDIVCNSFFTSPGRF